VASAQRLGDLTTECFLHYLEAVAYLASDQVGRGMEAAQNSVHLAHRLQNPKLASWAHRVLSQSRLRAANVDAAHSEALLALTFARDTGTPHDISAAGAQLAQAQLALGLAQEAGSWAAEQRPATSGRTPPVSLQLCATATEAMAAAGMGDSARRWAAWTRRWRSFLGGYCLRSLRTQALAAEKVILLPERLQ